MEDLETLDDLIRACSDAMTRGAWEEAEAIGNVMDRLWPPKSHPASLFGAALWYAEHGLPVFPLQPGSKIPLLGTHGCKDASCDPKDIHFWWGNGGHERNIGIATGHLVDVIDVDGVSWAKIKNLPPILGTVSTPRPGGTHLYVRSTGEGNHTGTLPGVDYRGRGGYVVAPPSVHRCPPGQPGCGMDGTSYYWRTPLVLAPEREHR